MAFASPPLLRTGIWLAAALALSGCVDAGRLRPAAHVAKPGYSCDVGRAFEPGAWAHATLDASGRQVEARWDWHGTSGESLLRFSAAGSVDGPPPLDARDGYASVQWAVAFPRTHRPPLWRLELRSAPESRYWFGSGFVSDYERTGDHLLMASWPDLAAFARGSTRLAVILRDRNAKVVKRAEVDPAVFTRGEAEIAATLKELAAMAADFRQRCQAFDDIDTSDIIVA